MSEDPTGLLIFCAIALAIVCGLVQCTVGGLLTQQNEHEAKMLELRREVRTPCR